MADGQTFGGSTYTQLDLAACTDVTDQWSIDGRCEGYGGIDVLVSRGEGKHWVEYGRSDGIATAFENTATVGDTIEWLLAGSGKPYAAIVRYSADALEGVYDAADVLVVHTIAADGESSCLLAAIDASETEQANGFARGAAASGRLLDACGVGPFIAVGSAGSPVHRILSFE